MVRHEDQTDSSTRHLDSKTSRLARTFKTIQAISCIFQGHLQKHRHSNCNSNSETPGIPRLDSDFVLRTCLKKSISARLVSNTMKLKYKNHMFTGSCTVDQQNCFKVNSDLGHLQNLRYFDESSCGVLLVDRDQTTETQVYSNSVSFEKARTNSDYVNFLNFLIPCFRKPVYPAQSGETSKYILGTCFNRINVFVET